MTNYVIVKVDGTSEVVGVPPHHGVDGWVLLDMEWNPDSGVSEYEYAQYDLQGKYLANHKRTERQPYEEKHEGWSELWGTKRTVFSL